MRSDEEKKGVNGQQEEQEQEQEQDKHIMLHAAKLKTRGFHNAPKHRERLHDTSR